ncbi:tRNA (N6-isopentenyl adenosine(37)-C2)-methylthiotransferase MiaB [Candidatus Uhrbacteria bacterium]|nr:tRNA (N6-isopentenyl adenosine(37)-C2)-methylthiotransferase MiaB [Candidatus Uhrbacteria bacterium]
MNKNDSERAAALLEGLGFSSKDKPEDSDLVIINTCSVRQTAEDRVYGMVEKLAKLKEKNSHFVLAVMGCMPGRDKDGSLRKKLPAVDFFFPTARITELPKWIAETFPEIVNSDVLAEDYLKLAPKRETRVSGYLTIQTGCNYFCTYCVVPFARGLERNRPVADILEEARALAESGCLEITLLGQTVNSFRAADPENFSKNNPYHDHFAALLWEINQIPGISRVHWTAPHPRHMTDEVINALALPKQVNFLHLPVQSGDNEILRKMNRRYKAEEYLELVEKINARRPGIALGTDIIVGFCGETEEQFARTVELYKKADFDIAFLAMYSPRSGTAAKTAFADTVPREEKRRRWRVLQDLMEEIVLAKNQKFVGNTAEVLVDKCDSRGPAQICLGNSNEMKVVQFNGTPDDVGKIVKVKITKAREWVLEGTKI